MLKTSGGQSGEVLLMPLSRGILVAHLYLSWALDSEEQSRKTQTPFFHYDLLVGAGQEDLWVVVEPDLIVDLHREHAMRQPGLIGREANATLLFHEAGDFGFNNRAVGGRRVEVPSGTLGAQCLGALGLQGQLH